MPTVDELFPEGPQSVDTLFPVEVERERNRQRQFNTSPVQDLIFGDTSVNPVARVLDAFGQGARHAWGSHTDTLDKESEDFLKLSKRYDEWSKAQSGITKAANETLFRPAATQLYNEFRDVQAVWHGIGAGIEGGKAAIAQVGTELSGGFIDSVLRRLGLDSMEKLGRETAGAVEAFPSGLRQPTGTFRSLKFEDLTREFDRARDLKTIGAGEEGYLGTAEVPAPAAKEQASVIREAPIEAAKPAEAVTPAVEAPAEPASRYVAAPINAEHPIAQDVTRRLVEAGRPADEASAAGQIIASHYETRAERLGGAAGTAEELYAREGAEIRGKGTRPTEEVAPMPEPKPVEGGAEVTPQPELELEQVKRGKIRLREDAKPIITLFKDANESTFMHETGHQWLEELFRDARHKAAPADLLADSKAVLDWFGVDDAAKIKTRHHEQFARGFERYLMEGVAPSRELAGVFAKFKEWLTRIYETVTRLKSPINDEIRGVFDRLIARDPEKVKIEPEAPKTFADIHEADALDTLPSASHPVAETIRAERDRLAIEQIPEENDARLEGVASGAGRREAGGPQPLRDRNEAEPRPTEARNDQAAGEISASGNNAPQEGAGPSASPRAEVPVSAGEPFKTAETPFVDKAGNIRLDNLSTAEDVNKAIRDAAKENNEFIDARRGVITDGQVLELADALGMDAGKINQRKLGEAFNAEQIMAARKLLIQSATNVRDAMLKAANGTEADILAYAAAKDRHQMIQSHVAGITAEAGRALRAFRKLEGQQEAAQLDAFLKDATGKTLFQLQLEAQLGSQLETPAQVSGFINGLAKPTLKDMIIETWMAFLLSGLKTHAANITGNTISGLFRSAETATAAAIGKARSAITGSQERVLFGEAAAELFGMVQGSKEGVVAAYKAFKTEQPQLTSALQTERAHQHSLPSATVNLLGREMEIGGKQVRIPLRLLGAEDEFFKAVAFRGDINRQAYAIAAREGLSSERLSQRVAELAMNPTEEMIAHAKGVADYQTFQTPLGNVGRNIQNFANSHILAKLVIPFVRTPLNLLKYANERTPLGLFAREVRENLSGKNGAVARDTQIARITLGTMIGVAAFELASQGLITGGGPADPKKKAVMRANGWQDYSVRIGDMYYRYNRLDPFSIILGVVADAWEISQAAGEKDLDKQHLPALIFGAISKNILDRASLKGPSDLIQAVTDPERYGKGYIKGLAGTIVPAISAQTAQTVDPIVREARGVVDNLKARIPGLSQTLMPKRDIWGEPIVREGGLGPDIASPIMESRLKNDPVNKALIGVNYFPGKLDRKIRGVELTDQQYDDYARIAGRTAKMRLDMIVKMSGFEQMPETVRKDLMTKAITSSREMARSLILMQNPEILRKANDAKAASLRGEKVH